jgi:predicted NBD/HSP70 family sugar kinase
VSGLRLAQASGLGWHDVDLSTLWPNERGGRPLIAGNDSRFAAIAERSRGAAVGARLLLHLYMDSGIGGAAIEGGRVLAGSIGIAGEFGHMPFGDPTRRCPCGAFGCWGMSLDGERLATLLGDPPPGDVVSYSHRVLDAAKNGGRRELAAARDIATALGRGAAGLVNAFDPDVVTIGGTGRDLLAIAGPELAASYLAGMMRFRPSPPPPIVPAHFGVGGPVVGAVEEGFSLVLSDEGIRSWGVARGA